MEVNKLSSTAFLIVFFATLLVQNNAVANSNPITAAAATTNPLDAIKINNAIELPVKAIQAVNTDSAIFFISKDGRYAFKGQMYDVWEKKSLKTMDDISYSATHISLKKLGVNVDSLNTITLNKSQSTGKDVVIFIDPQCSICHQLIKNSQALASEYNFKFIVVPALGEKSNELSKKLFCATDKTNAVSSLLNNAIASMPQKQKCDLQQYNKTLLFAQMINIDGVPFLIAPDGRINKGMPQNLKTWIGGV